MIQRRAKESLEAEFQLTYFEQPTEAFNMCGIPDGPFRSVVFPLSVHNLRHAREWLQSLIAERPFPYPVAAKAMLISQSINYVEGKAPVFKVYLASAKVCYRTSDGSRGDDCI